MVIATTKEIKILINKLLRNIISLKVHHLYDFECPILKFSRKKKRKIIVIENNKKFSHRIK